VLSPPPEKERGSALTEPRYPKSSRRGPTYKPTDGAAQATAPSPEAISAARDLIFEALTETGVLIGSYGNSLAEAAFRGDKLTVETHLRQIRSCLLAGVDNFKQFDVVQAKGGAA
jgi:S-methylmethionine-dependent homocysteine/selenocysteine methylase